MGGKTIAGDAGSIQRDPILAIRGPPWMLGNVTSEQQRRRIFEAQRAGTLQRLIMGGMSRERAERWLSGLARPTSTLRRSSTAAPLGTAPGGG